MFVSLQITIVHTENDIGLEKLRIYFTAKYKD